MSLSSMYCYILRNGLSTYVGFTVDPFRRIRQHNGEIKGGARRTSRVGKGWELMCLIGGLTDQVNALQLEWRLKKPENGKNMNKYRTPDGRMLGLLHVMKLDKWTGNSVINSFDLNLRIWVVSDLYDKYTNHFDEWLDHIEVIRVDEICKEYVN